MDRDRKSELLALYEAGDESLYQEVLNLYEKALEKDPENTELLHKYGFIYEKKGMRLLQKAACIYEKSVEIEMRPENIRIIEKQRSHGQLISLRSRLGQSLKSIEIYKSFIDKYPDLPNGYCHLAHAYVKAEQISEAKLTIETGYKIFPNDPAINYWMGEVYSRLGNVNEALYYFKVSVETDPVFISARYSRAFLFERESRWREAADEWRLINKYLYETGGKIEARFSEDRLQKVLEKMAEEKI